MLSIIWTCLVITLKVLGITLCSYLFYWRVIDYAYSVWFYGRQGKDVVVCTPGHMPFFGNLFQIIWSMIKSKREGDNYHIAKHVLDYAVSGDSLATSVTFASNTGMLVICDPAVVAELYTSKNKYFDKHPLTKKTAYCLTGESILFAETTQDWKDTRKAMSPAFHKGKLENLTECAKIAMETTVKRFENILKGG